MSYLYKTTVKRVTPVCVCDSDYTIGQEIKADVEGGMSVAAKAVPDAAESLSNTANTMSDVAAIMSVAGKLLSIAVEVMTVSLSGLSDVEEGNGSSGDGIMNSV